MALLLTESSVFCCSSSYNGRANFTRSHRTVDMKEKYEHDDGAKQSCHFTLLNVYGRYVDNLAYTCRMVGYQIVG